MAFQEKLSNLSEHTERAVRSKALAAEIGAILKLRKVCKIIAAIVFATCYFSFSAFKFVELSFGLLPPNLSTVWFYLINTLVSFFLILFTVSDWFWINTLGLDKKVRTTLAAANAELN